MNNILVLGSRTGATNAWNFQVTDPLNYVTAYRFESNGAWVNAEGDTDEEGLIAKNKNSEIDMMCHLAHFTNPSVPTVAEPDKNCLFFKAPVEGIFKIARKEKIESGTSTSKLFLVFVPLNGNSIQVSFSFDIFRQTIGVGNSIVIGLDAPDFDTGVGSMIVKKSWVDYILREIAKPSPVPGPILGRERVGRRWRDRHLFSIEELREVKNATPENRLSSAWTLSANKFTEEILGQYPFPIVADGLLPLYSFNIASELDYLRLTLGFSDIPHSGANYIFEDGWTWFDPVKVIQKVEFSPAWNIANIPSVEPTDPIVAWHAHPQPPSGEENAVKITKLSNQQCKYFNPNQVQYPDSLNATQKRQKDKDAGRPLAFFLANRFQDTIVSANTSSQWYQRSGGIRRNIFHRSGHPNQDPPSFDPINDGDASLDCNISLSNPRDFLQVKASNSGGIASHAHVITAKLSENDSDEMFNNFINLFGAATPETAEQNTFSNGDEINQWFIEKTGHNYLNWFNISVRNTTFNGTNHFSDRRLYNDSGAHERFLNLWRNPGLIFSERSESVRINIFQFFSLMTIIANETPTIEPKAENGFISYYFERIKKTITQVDETTHRELTIITETKASYNRPARATVTHPHSAIPAGYLFFDNDPSLAPPDQRIVRQRYRRQHELFWREHSGRDFNPADGFPSVRSISMDRWNGSIYPRTNEAIEAIDLGFLRPSSEVDQIRESQELFNPSTYLFPNPIGRVNMVIQGKILAETDFCKFRGRGFIQVTWRYNYTPLIELIRDESWEGSENIRAIKNRWIGISHDVDDIATISRNEEWDTLFYNTDFVIPCRAIFKYQKNRGNMLISINNSLSIDRLLERREEPGTIYNVGGRIGTTEEYPNKYLNRVKQQMKALLVDYRRIHPTT